MICDDELLFSLLQAPDGESQPSTEVDLFVSTEKIMVLNTNRQVNVHFLSKPTDLSRNPMFG